MGKNKGFLFAVRHREILMTDLGLLCYAIHTLLKVTHNIWKYCIR